MIDIVDLNYADAVYIARRMRAADREEIYAVLPSERPEDLAALSAYGNTYKRCVVLDGEPVATIGCVRSHPTLGHVWMFATDKWPRVALSTTRFVLREALPRIFGDEGGFLRLECRAHGEHRDACRWLKHLGFVMETPLLSYGKGGQMFQQFAMTKSGWDIIHGE